MSDDAPTLRDQTTDAEIKMLENVVERLRGCADMLEAHGYEWAPKDLRACATSLEGDAEGLRSRR